MKLRILFPGLFISTIFILSLLLPLGFAQAQSSCNFKSIYSQVSPPAQIPKKALSKYRQGLGLFENGDIDLAEEILCDAIKILPRETGGDIGYYNDRQVSYLPYYYLAKIYFKQGKCSKGNQAAAISKKEKKLLKIDSDNHIKRIPLYHAECQLKRAHTLYFDRKCSEGKEVFEAAKKELAKAEKNAPEKLNMSFLNKVSKMKQDIRKLAIACEEKGI